MIIRTIKIMIIIMIMIINTAITTHLTFNTNNKEKQTWKHMINPQFFKRTL